MTAPLARSLTGEYCSFSPVVCHHTLIHTQQTLTHKHTQWSQRGQIQARHFCYSSMSSRRPFQSHRHEFPHPSNRSGLKGQTHTHTQRIQYSTESVKTTDEQILKVLRQSYGVYKYHFWVHSYCVTACESDTG